MRNAQVTGMGEENAPQLRRLRLRESSRIASANAHPAREAFCILFALLLLSGCVDTQSRQRLNDGYRALDAQRYDEAGAAANDYLARHPTGPGAAEAFYLQGRAYELRADSGEKVAAARNDLDAARAAYLKGLGQPAPPSIAAHLHSGLANVAYFEDDFNTAIREWRMSYPNLKDQEARAWVLYRIGLCQQRLGEFAGADQSFRDVREQFPATEAATRAAARIGAKAFYVQVGSFTDLANAQKLADSLKKQGLPATVAQEGQGRYAVRVGPASTYADAKSLKSRVSAQFPQAMIMP
jgi:outer membrane protein assembly factor BamD (BamD/ComL family)